MNTNKLGMFVILSLATGAAISGTALTGMAAPAFANGDNHDEKKCKNNGDNNCNDKHKTQKTKETVVGHYRGKRSLVTGKY